METTAITPGGAPRTTTNRGLESLRSEDFFKILVTELQQQDPLKPSETSDMIGNVAQVRSIEVSSQLGDALSQISNTQRTSGVSDLLGKFVSALTAGPDGQPLEVGGVVTGVRFNPDGAAQLELDNGLSVSAEQVTHVTTLEVAAAAATGTAPAAPAKRADEPGDAARAAKWRPLDWLRASAHQRAALG